MDLKDSTVLQLVADLQLKIANIESQLSLMKPIAAKVVDVVKGNLGNLDIADLLSPAKTREQELSLKVMEIWKKKTPMSRTASKKAPKKATLSTAEQEDWKKSFAFNYVEPIDTSARASEPATTTKLEIDRDKVFTDAEGKEKEGSLWSRLAKKVKTTVEIGSDSLNKLSDSVKKLAQIHEIPGQNSDTRESTDTTGKVIVRKLDGNSSRRESITNRIKLLARDSVTKGPKLPRNAENHSRLAEVTNRESITSSGITTSVHAVEKTSFREFNDSQDSLRASRGSNDSYHSYRNSPKPPEPIKLEGLAPNISIVFPAEEPLKPTQLQVDVPKSPVSDNNSKLLLLPASYPTTSLSRKKSVIYTTVIAATTTAKYNEKGSLASLNDKKFEPLARRKSTNPKQLEPESISYSISGLNPLSSFCVNWEFFMSGVYISVLWVIPLMIGFDQPVSLTYSIFLTTFYSLDIIVEAFTFRSMHPAIIAKKEPTLKDWQKHYFKTVFLVDLSSAIPFEMLPVVGNQYLWLIRILRVYKLQVILQKSPKYIQIRTALEKALGIGQTFSGIFPLMFALCAFLHVQACAIFWSGRISGYSNSAIEPIQYRNVGDQYTWALFTAVGNTFPLTYKPSSTLEQLIVLVFIMVGAGLYASIVGTISSFAIGMDASGRLYKQKIDELREYMRWKDLSPTTQRKVLKYYEIKYRGKFFEEGTLLAEMNESLRMEIAAHNCRQLIQKVNFLRREEGDGRDELFIGRIATSLKPCYYVPGDVVITQGEIGHEMYFILHGSVDIIVNGKKVVQFSDGAFFGELALIANIPRTATVQASISCMLYCLTRANFASILSEFEDMRKRIDIIYNERMAKVKLEEEEKARQKQEEEFRRQLGNEPALPSSPPASIASPSSSLQAGMSDTNAQVSGSENFDHTSPTFKLIRSLSDKH